ncbi:MAG: transposase [Deltaproteobacteria bacterium]|nr:MAG: transposase [Deltaproteobacteria bacterium]
MIKSSYHESRETYGAIRVHRDIHNQGTECGKNRVARLMKVSGLKSIHKLKYRPQTTQSKANDLVSPNVISKDFYSKNRESEMGL